MTESGGIRPKDILGHEGDWGEILNQMIAMTSGKVFYEQLENDKLRQEVKDLKQRLRRSNEDNVRLREALCLNFGAHRNRYANVGNTNDPVADLEAKIDALNESNHSLFGQVDNLCAQLFSTKGDLQQAREQLQEARDDLRRTTEDLGRTTEDLQQAREDLQQAGKEITEAERLTKFLREQFLSCLSEVESFWSQLPVQKIPYTDSPLEESPSVSEGIPRSGACYVPPDSALSRGILVSTTSQPQSSICAYCVLSQNSNERRHCHTHETHKCGIKCGLQSCAEECAISAPGGGKTKYHFNSDHRNHAQALWRLRDQGFQKLDRSMDNSGPVNRDYGIQ
jgi:hypothetical protein